MRRKVVLGAVGVVGLLAAGGAVGLRSVTPKTPPLLGAPVAVDGATCLAGATVLGGPPGEVCFRDGQIVGAQATPARRIDAAGLFVMPGLVDTHVHVTATEAPPWHFRLPDPKHTLQAYLAAGITTVFDMGGPTKQVHALAEEVKAGTLLGPQLFHTHPPFTVPGGHPIPAVTAIVPWPLNRALIGQVPVVDSASQAEALVAAAAADGAQYIKLIHDALPPGAPRFDVERLKAVIDAAHRLKLKAVVHIGSNRDALEAVRAGADHLAHGVYRDAVSDELVAALRERQVPVTVTAAGFANTRALAAGRYQPDAFAKKSADPSVVDAVSGEAGTAFARTEVLGDFARGIADESVLRENVQRLHEGGVTVLVGTDSPIAAVFPGGSYLEELLFLESAGLPRELLLRRATEDNARWLDPEARFGSLAPGMRADVLVLRADPRVDLRALREIERLFVGGREVPLLE